jgi:nucleotide-binding universal stress UspA family protein
VAARAAESLRARGREVETRVCHAQAADALIDESKGADLLVVGSRGHGGFSGLLLGSVGQQCAHHASCPTVVVR